MIESVRLRQIPGFEFVVEPYDWDGIRKAVAGGVPDFVLTNPGSGRTFIPFFTTKSAGSGTGLGLSMSCDIVVQGHGGTFEVESQEGPFTCFNLGFPRGIWLRVLNLALRCGTC